MGTFEENARPTQHAVARIFSLLRSEERPFASETLAAYLDLMLLPFLSGLATPEQRVQRLRLALDFVTSELTDEHKVLYRNLLAAPPPYPAPKRWGPTCKAINDQPSRRHNPIAEGTVRKHAQAMCRVLARTLLDPEFARQFDEQFPVEREDGSQPKLIYPSDAHELLEYAWTLEVSTDDHRRHTEQRHVKTRVAVPHQRVIAIRYHTNRTPAEPEKGGVELRDPRQTYLGTIAEQPEGAPAMWWMHFIHVGRRAEVNDEVTVESQEHYFDEGEGEQSLFLAQIVRDESLGKLNLGIKLPSERRAEVQPVAGVYKDPLDNRRQLVESWPVKISRDGWIREEFTKFKVGLQYGIFLPNFDLYKK